MALRQFKKLAPASSKVCVLAVGNLSVGGTGKSVFVEWLIKNGKLHNPAVLMGGYKSPVLQRQESFVVSNGSTIYGGAALVGDEPLQVAEKNRVPVAIGKHRGKTLGFLLAHLGAKKVDTVILDDGYQTNTIYKNCTILLIDARSPLGNGHLFPAGPLREKDYKRADIIIFTHADQIIESIESLRRSKFPHFDKKRIFAGRHAPQELRRVTSLSKEISQHQEQSCVLISGIAQPKNLETSVQELGIKFLEHHQFVDHHVYLRDEIEQLLQKIVTRDIRKIITTQKDWTKLRAFLGCFEKMSIDVYVLSIRFEFLNVSSYDIFIPLLHEILYKNDRERV